MLVHLAHSHLVPLITQTMLSRLRVCRHVASKANGLYWIEPTVFGIISVKSKSTKLENKRINALLERRFCDVKVRKNLLSIAKYLE